MRIHQPYCYQHQLTIRSLYLCSRGTKTYFHNPLYKPPGEEASDEEDRSRLPENHLDFSPSDACPPKLLWPEARTRDHARRHRRGAAPHHSSTPSTPKRASRRKTSEERVRSEWDSTDDEQDELQTPVTRTKQHDVQEPEESIAVLGQVLAQRITRRTAMAQSASPDEEAPRTQTRSSSALRIPEKDRSDPVRRAVGPVRPGGK